MMAARAAPIASHLDGSRLKPATLPMMAMPRMVDGSFNFASSVFMVFLLSTFYTAIPRQCKFREREREREAMPRPPRTRSTQPLRVQTSRRTYEKRGCPLAQTTLGDEFFGKCAWLQNNCATLSAGREFDLDLGRDRGCVEQQVADTERVEIDGCGLARCRA
jgi:hypothetical protein